MVRINHGFLAGVEQHEGVTVRMQELERNASATPRYEIWGQWIEDSKHGAPDEFLEDVFTLEEARKAEREYSQSSVRYAYVRDKETGEIV